MNIQVTHCEDINVGNASFFSYFPWKKLNFSLFFIKVESRMHAGWSCRMKFQINHRELLIHSLPFE